MIEEVDQHTVEKPSDLSEAIDALKRQGKKTVLLLVAGAAGEVRFVGLGLN